MVRNEPDNALNLPGGNVGIRKKFPRERPALELLIFAVRAAVFLAAQRARNVMDDGASSSVLRASSGNPSHAPMVCA